MNEIHKMKTKNARRGLLVIKESMSENTFEIDQKFYIMQYE